MGATVEEVIAQAFPGQTVGNIVRIPGGVSGSTLARVDVGGRVVVAKVGPRGVGKSEREGATKLTPFMNLPAECGQPHDDHYMYEFVPGQTVDELVRETATEKGGVAMKRYVDIHAAMWLETLARAMPSSGYPLKIRSTRELLRGCQIGGRSLEEIAHTAISINGKLLPSIDALLWRLEEIMREDQQTVLSHGDEGACNAIVTPRGKQFFIDHGTVGHRLLCEPVVKTVLWFPATTAQPGAFSIKIGKKIQIEYSVRLDPVLRALVRSTVKDLFTIFRGHLSRHAFYAALTMYLLREMQWLRRRGRELMLVYVLAMALEAGTKLFGAKGSLAYM